MNSSRIRLLFLLPILMLGGGLLMQARVHADGYDPLRDYKSVSLKRLIDKPSTFKNTDIKFKAYFHKVDDLWSPFYSPFDPDNYISFSVWPEEARLWVKNEVVKDFPFLYIKNDSDYLQTVLATNKYAMVRLKGTVRSAFNGYPWIEVRHFEVLRTRAFNPDTLQTLIRAREAAHADTPTKATRYYEKALSIKSVSLTSTTRAYINRELAVHYFKSFEYKKALNAIKAYRNHSDETDTALNRIEEKANELLNLPAEERHQYEREKMKGQDKSSSYLPIPKPTNREFDDAGPLRKKYRTLLSSYRKVIENNQSLENRNDRLENRLNNVLQSRAKLQAKLRQARSKKRSLAGSSPPASEPNNHDPRNTGVNGPPARRISDLRKRLSQRIRTLKRRNRSLRTRVSTLSRRVPNKQGKQSEATANRSVTPEPGTAPSDKQDGKTSSPEDLPDPTSG